MFRIQRAREPIKAFAGLAAAVLRCVWINSLCAGADRNLQRRQTLRSPQADPSEGSQTVNLGVFSDGRCEGLAADSASTAIGVLIWLDFSTLSRPLVLVSRTCFLIGCLRLAGAVEGVDLCLELDETRGLLFHGFLVREVELGEKKCLASKSSQRERART